MMVLVQIYAPPTLHIAAAVYTSMLYVLNRVCTTLRPVHTKLDRYPIPKVEDLFANLSGGRTFTKIDLSQAYQQIPMEEESQKYVVINTHKGLFKYTRLLFGVSSAPGIFQRVMEGLLQGIPRVVVYLDDILITGTTDKEHIQALNEVLTRLEKVGLRVKKEKCAFMVKSIKYLGYRIDSEGLHPLKEKVSAITEAPAPKNVAELKAYLGLLTYYSKFLPNRSTALAPPLPTIEEECCLVLGQKGDGSISSLQGFTHILTVASTF